MKKSKIMSSLLAVAAFGLFTNVSAESYVLDSAPDTFTANGSGKSTNLENDAEMANNSIVDANVIDYHTKDKQKVFCIERGKQYAANEVYTKNGEVSDQLLAYIVAASDQYYKDNLAGSAVATENSTLEEVKKYEQSWLTQVAIWKYQSTLNAGDEFANTVIGTDNVIYENTLSSTSLYSISTRASDLWKEADKLIAKAKEDMNKSNAETLKFNFEGEYELDKDNKIIKTGLITSPITNFSLNLSEAPEGTKVYDQQGNELDSNNITTNTFYLTFPIDNVDNYSFDFNVLSSVINGVTTYTGYKYTNGTYQIVMLVVKGNKPLNGAINFKGSYVEDTASFVARSIYFVGFLILLAGVGVIYTNVKPKKEQI